MSCEVELLLGDCVERLRELEEASVDACVTDCPYELGFMGRRWDAAGVSFRPETWAEVLRVLKPGGYLLTFGGTRTVHRIAVAIEDAGFEIRDTIAWMFGSGFPKSLDVSKAIDSKLGQQGEYGDPKTPRHAEYLKSGYGTGKHEGWDRPWMDDEDAVGRTAREYLPATEEARAAKGWGTALKPAFEPVVVARKPLEGTVAENVLEYGVGAINVDACRIAYAGPDDQEAAFPGGATTSHGSGRLAGPGDAQDVDRSEFVAERPEAGRWPANVVLSHTPDCVLAGSREVRGDGNWSGATESVGYEGGWDTSDHPRDQRVPRVETVEVWECAADCPIRLLDEQAPDTGGGGFPGDKGGIGLGLVYGSPGSGVGLRDTGRVDANGGASRFFYCAKTSRTERNAGLGAEFEARMLRWSSGDESPGTFQSEGTDRSVRNHHPTVKPIELMRWLVRLVTPPGGVLLDPFLGSGSTGCAAVLEPTVGRFVGIERDPEYVEIAKARVRFWQEHGETALDVVRAREQSDRSRREAEDAGQLDLLG